jgi:hypothetical protein
MMSFRGGGDLFTQQAEAASQDGDVVCRQIIAAGEEVGGLSHSQADARPRVEGIKTTATGGRRESARRQQIGGHHKKP